MTAPRCFGVLGHPIGHSKSPAMHAAAFEVLGLSHRYLAFDVTPDSLPAAIAGAAAMGFGGLNLTVPLKTHALPLMDALGPEAEAIGAVNTVCFTEEGLLGRNTDGVGFLEAARALVGDTPGRAVVLGGGGASRAVVYALREAGSEVCWVSRRPEGLPAWDVDRVGYESLTDALGHADLLVNGTTVGMDGGAEAFPVPLELDRMPSRAAVADLVYPATPLVGRAQARGLRTMDGVPMLWGQGVRALEHWLGVTLDSRARDAMLRSLTV